MSAVGRRKIWRDVMQAKSQYASIAMMVALGIAFLIGAYSVYQNLDGSYRQSYDKLRFEDFSIRFNSAPQRVTDRIRALPGVLAAEGRLVEETALELPGRATGKLVGRLIGIPTHRPLKVNQLKIVAGRMVRPNAREVLIEAEFAEHHRLRPGDEVVAERLSSRLPLRIAGIVQSDEYLYVVRSKQELIAMPDTFGVMFADEDVLGGLFRKPGEINEIHAIVVDPARTQTAMAQTKRALRAYKPEEPVDREDQPSYQMLQQDVVGFRAYAVLFPILFLGVAAVSVFSMLTRVVHAKRPEIGLLRSLGYSARQVLLHYLGGTVAVGLVASLAGVGLGLWLAQALSEFYMSQLQVPYPQIVPRWGAVWTGVFVGIGTCALSGAFPAAAAARIGPAEAMRPLTPSFGRSSFRMDALMPRLSILARIPLRNVFRQPRRTTSTLVGVVSGMCLMVTAAGLLDSMDSAIEKMMRETFAFDLRADFYEYQSRRVVLTVRSWPGVNWAEGMLELPIECRHGAKTYSSLLNGVEPNSRLRRLVDDQGRPVPLSEHGAIFGPALRTRLGLRVGDVVEVSLPEYLTREKSTVRRIVVAGFCQEPLGTQAYLPRARLESLFRDDLDLPGNAITSVQMRCDPRRGDEIRRRLLDLPYAASALSMASFRSQVRQLMDTARRFVRIMELFGAALALATIFNMINMNVMERQAEVATLRTLGVRTRAIRRMVAVENLVVAGIGIALGIPIARWFVELFWKAAQTEEQQDLFTFNVVVLPWTFVQAALAILVATLLSLPAALRFVGRLDLVRAVKERSN